MATTETILEATIKAGVEHFGGFPSGTIIAFAGKSVPDGWLLCNGALVSRTTYAKLFTAIGTAWGAGDGSTTFKLPDADGRVMQGVTNVSNVGQYLEAGLPNITGIDNPYGIEPTHSYTRLGGAFYCDPSNTAYAGYNHEAGALQKQVLFDAQKSNSKYGSSDTIQPSAIQTLIIIKV